VCVCVCVYRCVQLSYTVQNSSDNLLSYPSDSRHCLDACCQYLDATTSSQQTHRLVRQNGNYEQ